jgi:exopolysaccharide biosynthesis protein
VALSRNFFKAWLTWITVLTLLLTVVWPVRNVSAITEYYKYITKEQTAEGVTVEETNIQTPEGPLNIYVMTVDLTNQYVKVDSLVGSKGVITTAKTTSNMAKGYGAIGAINGDYFQLEEKAPIGITVQSGNLVTSPAQRRDMYSFGLTKDNRPVFDIFSFAGTVTATVYGSQFPLYGINKPTYLAGNGISADINHLNMYTLQWGSKSRGMISGLTGMVEVVVEYDAVKEIRIDQPGVNIPQGGYVLAGHGAAGQFLTTSFQIGEPVVVNYSFAPENSNLVAAIGGQALLVDNGQVHWFSQNITGRRARTVIGSSRDGKNLYLVVVEGGNGSRGMTQEELADFMISIGAWRALNLDGGGSSAMVARMLGDQSVSVLNTPVYTSERAVPTGLGVFSTAPSGDLAGFKVSGPRFVLVGTKRSFTAKGYDVHYNPYSFDTGKINWEVSPDSGTFAGNMFSAEQSGLVTVKAVYSNVYGMYNVRILGSNDIAKVEVSPSSISLNPGESVTISVKVTTKQGAVFALQPNEYSLEMEGDIGTLTGNEFTAGDHMAVGSLAVKVDSTVSKVRVAVGAIEKPLYGFETARTLEYRDYPVGQTPGSFRLTNATEPTFRGAGAARLEYDFTQTAKTRAAYGSFTGGLALPGQPLGLGLWVMGDGGNGHWLRARIADAGDTEKLLDLTQNVDWTGWRYVSADLPDNLKFPVRLTDIYLVETEGGVQDKGVIYFDELSLKIAPTSEDINTKPPVELSEQKDIVPGVKTSLNLGSDVELIFNNPVTAPVCSFNVKQVWSTKLPASGLNLTMPLYNLTCSANGDNLEKLPSPVTVKLKVYGDINLSKAGILVWDEAKYSWSQIPCQVDKAKKTVTAKTDRLGLIGLLVNARPTPAFKDTGQNWARDLIVEMAAKKIVGGYPDGSFLPAKGVTRAEFITLLANTMGWAPEVNDKQFTDVIPKWAAGNVAAAVNRGVVKGYGDGTFQPHKVINRAEMAAMIDKALGLTISSQPSRYADAKLIPSWAVQSIRNTKASKVMLGNNNRFRPGEVANRAEATAVMVKVLNYYLNQI